MKFSREQSYKSLYNYRAGRELRAELLRPEHPPDLTPAVHGCSSRSTAPAVTPATSGRGGVERDRHSVHAGALVAEVAKVVLVVGLDTRPGRVRVVRVLVLRHLRLRVRERVVRVVMCALRRAKGRR